MISILIIEDDNAIRENTAEFLELEGYTTFTAPNGKKGLEKILLHKPDLILCDLRRWKLKRESMQEQMVIS